MLNALWNYASALTIIFTLDEPVWWYDECRAKNCFRGGISTWRRTLHKALRIHSTPWTPARCDNGSARVMMAWIFIILGTFRLAAAVDTSKLFNAGLYTYVLEVGWLGFGWTGNLFAERWLHKNLYICLTFVFLLFIC
jgi:hypothetical protein